MIPPIVLSMETLLAEDGMSVRAGVPQAVRDDPKLGEEFRQWVARCRKQEELKNLIREIQAIEQRISKGEATATGELRRVGESLIEMASA